MGSPGVVQAVITAKEEKSRRRFLKYSWTMAKNLFYLWLVFLAFGKMASVFETLVLALLILIFQSVGNSLTMFIRTFVEEAHIVRSLFLGIYKKFNDPDAAEGAEGLKASSRSTTNLTQFFISILSETELHSFTCFGRSLTF